MSRARGFHQMAPGTAPGDPSGSGFRPLGILGGRLLVVICGKPVAAPLVNVVAEIVHAVAIRMPLPYRTGPRPLSTKIVERFRRLAAPRIVTRHVRIAATRFLPFRFRRQSIRDAGRLGVPLAISHRVEPVHSDNRLIRITERWIVPLTRRFMMGLVEKSFVLAPCNAGRGDPEVAD